MARDSFLGSRLGLFPGALATVPVLAAMAVLVALPLLVALRIVTPGESMLKGFSGTVDLLIMLVVSLPLDEFCYFVDPLVGLLRVIFDICLSLLLQFFELTHAILLRSDPAGRPPVRVRLPTLAADPDARARPFVGTVEDP
jgi:hypothetical protein